MKQHSRILIYTYLTGVLGLTGIAMATSHFGWPLQLEIFSHFQAQYFLVLLLITAVTALLRNYRLLLVAIFCCALLSTQILPWYIPTHLGKAAANYRVLLANLNFGNKNADQTLALMAEEKPDLALFLEVSVAMEQQLTQLTTEWPYSTAIAAEDGILIYSKYPLENVALQQFGINSRKSLVANLIINNRPITLVAAHPLPPISAGMFAARNTLLADAGDYIKAQKDPVIFLGDLNVTPWSPYYRRLIQQTQLKNARQGLGLHPTWPRAVSDYYGLPNWAQWLIDPLQIPIDHCLISAWISVTGIHTGRETGSDHAPIVVDLHVPGTRSHSRQHWKRLRQLLV